MLWLTRAVSGSHGVKKNSVAPRTYWAVIGFSLKGHQVRGLLPLSTK